MKKTLIIVRHAHTYDQEPGHSDHDRELTPEGKTQAQKSAEWLKEQGSVPEKMVASSASRTRATAGIFARTLFDNPEKYESEKELYRATENELLEFIRQHFQHEESIMLVGHNPAVTQLAIRLGATSVSYLPPASVIVLSFNLENWENLNFHQGKLVASLLTDEA